MSNAAWWASRLQNPTSPPPTAAPSPRFVPQQRSYPPMSPPGVRSEAPAQATASRNASTCPECGSSNYSRVGKQTSSAGTFEVHRCFDCGYPLQQSGTGLASAASRTGAKADQVSTGGYNPHHIVGRVE